MGNDVSFVHLFEQNSTNRRRISDKVRYIQKWI